ncbi:MAG: zinc-binding dehydrogenase [Candidatus Omnitrophica bacterium]|nr:zinc-binding dehydrogenase [Candidatus Omnitrophota bacterium]
MVCTGRAVRRVQAGEAVAVDPAITCGQCDQCRAGRHNTCRRIRFLGSAGEAPGCMRDYIVMPESCLYPLRGGVSLEQAVLVEPFSIGVYAVKQSGLPIDGSFAVLGAGPIGLSVLLAAIHQRAGQSFITDRVDHRVSVAKRAGAAWAGNPDREDIVRAILERQPDGMDVVFECAGQPEALDQAVALLKPGGKLMLVGIPRQDRISLVIDTLRRNEIAIVNVRRQNHCVEAALELIASKSVDLDFMVTHRVLLEQASAAFETAAGYANGIIKAIINFESAQE